LPKEERMGDVVDLTVEILKQIRDEIIGMKGEIVAMKSEICGLRVEVRETNARLDHLVEFSGERWRALDRRVTELERRVGP